MVRSLVAGFGTVTLLAAAGSITPVGQAILGVKHAAAAPTTAAVVVQPKPVAKRVVPAKAAHPARPQARRAAVARRPQPAAAAPSGQSLNLSQFLPLLLQSQSLPAMLSQGSLSSVLSQAMPAASPFAGIGGGSSIPDLLQQLTSPAPAPEPAAAPQSVQEPASAAPTQAQPAPAGGPQWVPENRH